MMISSAGFKKLILFSLFSLLFLNYPGDFFYLRLYLNNRNYFFNNKKEQDYLIRPIPYVRNKNILPEITAQGVYLVDLDTFTPIFEKNANEKFFPASTVKMLTSLVSFDYFNLDQILKVKRIVSEPQTMNLVYNEEISFENLLYGLLIHSGNDAALTIADNFPGGEVKFVEKMNKKAKELFMENSFFKNPAGFDDFGQYTTPFDLALLGRAFLKNQKLKKIVAVKSIVISDKDYKIFHYLQNVNKLLGEISGIGGLKTGYTENAGENLVSYYKNDRQQIILVILRSDDRFDDTKKMINWFEENVDFYSLN